MSKILCIETATKVCSVALGIDGTSRAHREIHEDRFTHSENLNHFIDEVLKEADVSMSDLDAIAVSMGPGSYTGLRIGVSTAKGLCYALNLPLIAVSPLRAMAQAYYAAGGDADLAIPMIDARRMEVFCGVYDSGLNTVEPVVAKELDENSFSNLLSNRRVCFLGDGAVKFMDLVSSSNALHQEIYPSALPMIPLAHQKFLANDLVDVAYFEPFYLKDFVAGKPKKLV